VGNKTYGNITKKRTRTVLLALFDYVQTDIDNSPATFQSSDFECKGDDLTFLFKVKKTGLQRICKNDLQAFKDKEDQYDKEIRPAISRLLPALGVLIDKRSKANSDKGSDVWKFDITFWSTDRAENIERFNKQWELTKTNGGFELIESTVEQLANTPTNSNTTTPSTPPPRKLYGTIREIPRWVGRDELFSELQTDLQKHKVLVLSGQGGIGKTSLAVKLLEACGVDRSTSMLPDACNYANVLFCIVSESSSFDLVEEFLTAFGLPINRNARPEQVIRTIVQRLFDERWLVVIDNLESLMESDGSKAKSAEAGDLLNALAYRGHNSKVIITSRKFPEDLYDRRGKSFTPGIVCKKDIPGISESDSIQLLKDLGMQDSEADLNWIAGRVKGNVLILELLADYSEQPGQLRKEPELVTDTATPIVQAQWEKQSTATQELLKRMCVLRIEMNAKDLTTLRLLKPDGEAIEFMREEKKSTEDLLKGLVNCGLVEETYDKSVLESRYTLHRLISETLQSIFEDDLKILWCYAAKLYGLFEHPKNLYLQDDFRFMWEEVHFVCLLKIDSQSLVADALFAQGIVAHNQNKYDEAEKIFNKYLKLLIELDERDKIASSYYFLGDIARRQGDDDKAETLIQQCLDIETELNDREGMANSCGFLGDIALRRGDDDKAETLLQQSLVLRTESGDLSVIETLKVLGRIALRRGDYDAAEGLFNKYLKLFIELDERDKIASSYYFLGDIARRQGDDDKAETLLQQCLDIETELNNREGMAISYGFLGDIALRRGDDDKAETLIQKSVALYTELGNLSGIETFWEVLGRIALRRGDYDAAEGLFKQVLAVRTELNDRVGMASSWGYLSENELGRGNLKALHPE
jgi:tetratricopeptide (TPR) repeat protein